MKYEQCVIDGVLHHRTSEEGKWQPLTAEQLTTLLLDSRRRETNIVAPVYTPPVTAPVEYYNIPAWVPNDHNQPYRYNNITCISPLA